MLIEASREFLDALITIGRTGELATSTFRSFCVQCLWIPGVLRKYLYGFNYLMRGSDEKISI